MSSLLRPVTVSMAPQKAGDPRIGHLLGKGVSGRKPKFALIGFPTDEGVRINGGRAGAAEGCRALRTFFNSLCPDPETFSAFREAAELTEDWGDVDMSAGLEQAQENLGVVVAEALEQGVVPLIMGGGHETAFGHFLGYAQLKQQVAVVNIDAHLDVRPLIDGRRHSGSPFRDMLEHPSRACASYTVIGAQRFACAKEHVDYVRKQGGTIEWGDDLTNERARSLIASLSLPAFMSLDLDAVDQCHAPGVSAPVPDGMPPSLFLALVFEAGRNRHVSSLDIVELNPSLDRDNQTARLGALALWNFMRGTVEREATPRKSKRERL